MRKLSNTLAGALASATLLTGSLTPAAAAPTAAKCADPVKARVSVKIREARSTGSTALGLFPAGKKGCHITPDGDEWKRGGNYKAESCLYGSDNRWSKVNYRGTKGWVPIWCLVNA